MPIPLELDEIAARYLPNAQAVSTADSLDEACAIVGKNIHPHRLKVLEPTGPTLSCITSSLELGSCTVGYVQYGRDVLIESGAITEYLLIKSTLSGRGRVICGDNAAISAPGSIIMTSMTCRTDIVMTAQCRHLTVRVPRDALEASISEKLGRRLEVPLRFGFSVDSASDFGRGWHQLLTHICQISANAPSILATQAIRKQYSRTMIEMLIHAAPHNYSDALEGAVTASVPWHVSRARDYVQNHIADSLSVARIAASIGITTRTLLSGFRSAFDMTPAQYIRRARLDALGQALRNADQGRSVTDLMQACGIVNFGRYAQYYRQVVGELPSETLKRHAR